MGGAVTTSYDTHVLHLTVPSMPPPTASLRMNSITEQTYRSILARQESIETRRTAGLEESITSLTRQRYTSLHRDDNILGSLVETHAYLAHSDASLNGKDEVDVSERGNTYWPVNKQRLGFNG